MGSVHRSEGDQAVTNSKPPDGLKAEAIARWNAVAPGLRDNVDREALATYCQVWVRWQQAEDGIAKTGQLVKNAQGRPVANPLIAIAKDAGSQVRTLEQKLGIGRADPDDEVPGVLLTRRDLAAVMQVHMQTITKWEHDGLPIATRGRKGKPSTYREADVRAWLEARELAASKSGMVDVAQERARKENAQAKLAEQTYQVRARTLLPAEEVARIWSAEITAVRSVILSSYTTHADRIHRAATLDGLAGVEVALKTLAYEILRELAKPDRDIERAS